MKILILSNSHPYKTAGIVALDLYRGLKEIGGNEIKLLVNVYGKYPDKNVISLQTSYLHKKNWIIRKIRRILFMLHLLKDKLKTTNGDYYVQDYDQTITYHSTEKIMKRVNFKPDIIIVLFMQIFLSYKNLYELNQITKAPIFLYMMDMAPMTGGCHYAWNCKAYEKQCGKCPALYSEKNLDQSYINWKFKKDFVEKTNITVIAGTEWTFQQLNESSLFEKKQKHKVLLPINEKIFTLADKSGIRKQLGLPLDKKIIFFGSVFVKSRRKGVKELIEALNILNKQLSDVNKNNIHLAIAGKESVKFIKYLPFTYTLLGYLSHTELPKAFQAADVFVSASIEDSGPMMINQSIMCGIPVVSFEMGVALDLVITGETGYRAKLKDSNDLANGIKEILELNESEYKIMCANCRKLGLELCHPHKNVSKLLEIIND